jgi:hypothetical protein
LTGEALITGEANWVIDGIRERNKILGKRIIKQPKRFEPGEVKVRVNNGGVDHLALYSNFFHTPSAVHLPVTVAPHETALETSEVKVKNPEKEVQPLPEVQPELPSRPKINSPVQIFHEKEPIVPVNLSDESRKLKDTLKSQLLQMSEKVIDGFKIFHFDLPDSKTLQGQ